MEAVLKATLSGWVDLVEVAKAIRSGKTVRLPLEWPKTLRGEQPVEVCTPDVEEPLLLLVKRAGGRATAAGLRVRARPLDDRDRGRLERLASGEVDGVAAPERVSEGTAADDESALDDEAPPNAPWGDVRTGRTLRPRQMSRPEDGRTGNTLSPQPMSRPDDQSFQTGSELRGAEEAEAEAEIEARAEADEGVESEVDDAGKSDREAAPDIEFHFSSSIPPELAPPPDPAAEAAAALDATARALLADGAAADEQALVAAGTQGAKALCRVRIGSTVDSDGRLYFLNCMRELGDAAPQAIQGALDAALSEATRSGTAAALEDLLRAVPDEEDASLARAVTAMCSHPSGLVRHAAIAALPKVHGERAKPTLRDALRDDDESVRRAAIDGLRRLGGIDLLVLHRLEPILTGDEAASDELRAFAAAALADVDPEQREAALDTLHYALNPRTSLVSLFIKAEEANPMLVEAACTTMLLIGGPKERRKVAKQAARSQQPLRQRLEALLARHT